MSFRAGMDAPAPLRVLEPGETVTLPEMHLGMVFGDLDSAVQSMHDHVRRSVIMPQRARTVFCISNPITRRKGEEP